MTPEQAQARFNLIGLREWVHEQTWHKKDTDRHYTKSHAYRRCECTKPEDWVFEVIISPAK